MTSALNVNAIDKESGSTLTLGGSGTQVTLHASATSSGFASGLASVQVFTSSGTWTRPSGITKVIIEVQGAGASGNAYDSANRLRTGCAGGYAKKLLDVSSISSATITVGSGGAAVSGNNPGNDGGNSSWADGTNTITGNGGDVQNDVNLYAGDPGATATGGDINIQGQGSSNVATAYQSYSLGGGGNSMLGFAGQYDDNSSNNRYPDAVGYGSGGGSGYNVTSGAGAGGIVIVWEYK